MLLSRKLRTNGYATGFSLQCSTTSVVWMSVSIAFSDQEKYTRWGAVSPGVLFDLMFRQFANKYGAPPVCQSVCQFIRFTGSLTFIIAIIALPKLKLPLKLLSLPPFTLSLSILTFIACRFSQFSASSVSLSVLSFECPPRRCKQQTPVNLSALLPETSNKFGGSPDHLYVPIGVHLKDGPARRVWQGRSLRVARGGELPFRYCFRPFINKTSVLNCLRCPSGRVVMAK